MIIGTKEKPLFFSDLKLLALSPAHFKVGIETQRETTRGMRIGTIAHEVALGPNGHRPVKVFESDSRRGKEWTAFEAQYGATHELVTQPEWDEGNAIGQAVLKDPIAQRLCAGARFEVPLTWESHGFVCATRGIDVVAPGHIADLKVTQSAHPGRFQKLSLNMLYHAQLTHYAEAALLNGIDAARRYLIGVESSPPYVVTCLALTPEVTTLAERTLARWFEQLRACLDADQWPGYVQDVVDFEAPAWMGADDDD